VRRVGGLLVRAEQSGANAVLVTCSSIGECVDHAGAFVSIPVRRIDAPMAASAVRRGGPIAVAATLQSTLNPTVALLRNEAQRRGKRPRIKIALFDKAFQALSHGDLNHHDQIVQNGLLRLTAQCSTLVLAQASMARVAASLDIPADVKVLVSPESGVAQMKRLMA